MTPITREQAVELVKQFGDEATVMFSVKNLVAIFDEMADLRARLDECEERGRRLASATLHLSPSFKQGARP